MRKYLYYIKTCLLISFESSWEAANGAAGTIIGGGLFLLMPLSLISGASGHIKWENDALSLVIYTIAAWIILMILRAIFVSPYCLWKTAREKIDEMERINFIISIDAANISIPSDPPNSTNLALYVAIENTGTTPSIAKDWNLSVKPSQSHYKTAVFMRFGAQSENLAWKLPGGKEAIIPCHDALEDKTENKEVIGKVQGQLTFLLVDIPQIEVMDPKTELTLSVKDKIGKIYSTTETIESISRK